jgi:hypothetical protein
MATQLATPLGNKKKHMMDSDAKNASDLDPDNIIPVTLDDLSEEDRRELERELEDEMAEARKLKLSGYFKTRSGAVKKVTASKPPVHGTKVINSDEELAHLIDVSVASKYGSDMVDATRTITQLASKFDEFKEQFSKEIENSLPRQIRSLMYDENSGKAPIPPENSPFINLHSNTHTPGASASAMQPQIAVNSNQYGRNYAGSSANNFVSIVATPSVSTSVPLNYNNSNRSVCFNSNLQQPGYQTVAYNTLPLLPTGTGVPYGPVPDSYFHGSSQQTTHAQISLPEMPSRTHIPPVPQLNSLEPTNNFKDQLASILREFGLEPKGRARAYQKPYPDYFDLTPYPRGFRIPDFVKFTGEDGKSTFEHVGQFLAQCSEVGTSDVYRIKLFSLSLSGTAFTWFTSLAPNSISTWAQLEQKFHEYFYSGESEL